MKITVINGAPTNQWAAFETSLLAVKEKLKEGHEIEVFTVRDLNIGYCTGCFGCWVKTPGLCVIKDDMQAIHASLISSDLQIVLSPAVAGFISADAKKVLDREIPFVLPYIRSFGDECHHSPRYEKVPNLAVMLMDDGNLDEETKSITFDIFDRLGINLHAKRVIKKTVTPETLMEVIEYETCAD